MHSSGLSSILDLVDLCPQSQMMLFNQEEREAINQRFKAIYAVEPEKLNSDMNTTWHIISKVISQ
jgi:hypothetical protein